MRKKSKQVEISDRVSEKELSLIFGKKPVSMKLVRKLGKGSYGMVFETRYEISKNREYSGAVKVCLTNDGGLLGAAGKSDVSFSSMIEEKINFGFNIEGLEQLTDCAFSGFTTPKEWIEIEVHDSHVAESISGLCVKSNVNFFYIHVPVGNQNSKLMCEKYGVENVNFYLSFVFSSLCTGSLDRIRLSYSQRIRFFLELFSSLEKLMSTNNPLILADVSAKNILYIRNEGHYEFRFCDFGFSSFVSDFGGGKVAKVDREEFIEKIRLRNKKIEEHMRSLLSFETANHMLRDEGDHTVLNDVFEHLKQWHHASKSMGAEMFGYSLRNKKKTQAKFLIAVYKGAKEILQEWVVNNIVKGEPTEELISSFRRNLKHRSGGVDFFAERLEKVENRVEVIEDDVKNIKDGLTKELLSSPEKIKKVRLENRKLRGEVEILTFENRELKGKVGELKERMSCMEKTMASMANTIIRLENIVTKCGLDPVSKNKKKTEEEEEEEGEEDDKEVCPECGRKLF